VRYLEQAFTRLDFAQLVQVRHGLEERHIVLRNAPHLARPLPLVTPVFSWLEGLYFTIGLTIYGWFASGRDTLPGSRWLGRAALGRLMPHLSARVHSGILYYDGQLDDARYAWAVAQTSAQAGVALANHTTITGFVYGADGRIVAAVAEDALTGEVFRICARVFINCTGPQADGIRRLANPALGARLRPSKGVHVMLPHNVLDSDAALLIPKTADGRVVFAVPFQGRVMLGTTDTEAQTLDADPLLTDVEIDYLLDTLRPYLSGPVDRTQVTAGFGGLRPLVAADPTKSTKGLVRDHEVEHDSATGLVSLLGGKWTTYRLMAKDTIDFVAAHLLPNAAPCATADHPLVGSTGFDAEGWHSLQLATHWDEDVCRHIHSHYGDLAPQVVALAQTDAALAARLVPGHPYIGAEVVYAAQAEMACTVRDFVARRIRLEILDWAAAQRAAAPVAQLMGQVLGWSAEESGRAARAYIALVGEFRAAAAGDLRI
jgi:glycerol-3-phosphate dehydrogenase